MKTVLIFGATGTVGAYASLYLTEHNYNVIAVGSRKDDNGFFADYGIDYYVVIEVSTNTDGSARYGMSARDINTDRIIQEEKGKMILQDDGSYESEDYDYTFKFTDDGVLIGYMWDYFSYFDAYCYYCDWN